ncbi:MAG: murein biosynthesis integral membrane protein MurJ [bacterium]|nr:murein biosynthesis integral membrane protein MurJ [bacterium]
MVRIVLRKLSSTIMGGAIIIGSASILSRIVGLARDNLLAKYFGASATLDVYNAAFKVPDLLFNILVLGALSASFIPVFIERREKSGEADAFKTVNALLNFLLVAVLICIAISYIFAPAFANFLMAERSVDQQVTTALLMRVMLVSLIFFAVSNVISGVLNSYRRFLAYAIAPILYNVGIIIGITVFFPRVGIIGLAYGVVLGAFMHMLIQIPALLRTGFRYRFIWDISLPGVRKILKLMPPRALALGIVQINALIIAAFALRLEEGSLAVWTWADNLQHFPINVFGVSLALSSFPVFSQAFAEKDMAKFKNVFSENFRRIMFFIIPISIGFLLLRAQAVRLILGSFGGGQFDWNATILTAQILGLFSISMFAQASIPLLARSFFAHHDTKTPVYISIFVMIINVLLAWSLSSYFGIYGLAAAFSFSSLLSMLLLLTVLRLKFGDLDDKRIIKSVWQIVSAALIMGLVVHGLKYFIAPLVDMKTFVGIFTQTSVSIVGGALVYIGLAFLLKFDEVAIIREYISKIKQAIKKSQQ